MLQAVTGLLQLEPAARRSAAESLNSPYWGKSGLDVRLGATMAERGPVSVAQGRLAPRVTRWLQGDPFWQGIANAVGKPRRRECFTDQDRKFKHKEGGRTGKARPSTAMCNKLDCSRPVPAQRVGAFTRALLHVHQEWLAGLTVAIRKVVPTFPATTLGANGRQLLDEHIAENVTAFAVLQVMRPGEREDPAHFDDAASLLHGG